MASRKKKETYFTAILSIWEGKTLILYPIPGSSSSFFFACGIFPKRYFSIYTLHICINTDTQCTCFLSSSLSFTIYVVFYLFFLKWRPSNSSMRQLRFDSIEFLRTTNFFFQNHIFSLSSIWNWKFSMKRFTSPRETVPWCPLVAGAQVAGPAGQ